VAPLPAGPTSAALAPVPRNHTARAGPHLAADPRALRAKGPQPGSHTPVGGKLEFGSHRPPKCRFANPAGRIIASDSRPCAGGRRLNWQRALIGAEDPHLAFEDHIGRLRWLTFERHDPALGEAAYTPDAGKLLNQIRRKDRRANTRSVAAGECRGGR